MITCWVNNRLLYSLVSCIIKFLNHIDERKWHID